MKNQAGPAQDPWPPKPSRPGPGPLAPQAKLIELPIELPIVLPNAGFAHRHVCEASHTANVHTLNLFDMQNSYLNTLQTTGSNNLHMYRKYPNLHISSEIDEEDVHDPPTDSEEDVSVWTI